MIKVRFMALLNGEEMEIEAKASDVNSYSEALGLTMSVIKDDGRKIQKTMSQIGTNRVVVKFRVNPDGKNDNISIAEGKPESELATISKEAILESSGSCGEFSEALKKEKPNGFDWQLPFRIY